MSNTALKQAKAAMEQQQQKTPVNEGAIATLDKFEDAGRIKAASQKDVVLAKFEKGYREELATLPEDIAALEAEIIGGDDVAGFFGLTPALLGGSPSNGDDAPEAPAGEQTIDTPAVPVA